MFCNKISIAIFLTISLLSLRTSFSRAADSLFVIVSSQESYFVEKSFLDDKTLKEETAKLTGRLVGDLEEHIKKFSDDQITFLERELLEELTGVLEFEIPKESIDKIKSELKQIFNAAMLTKVEKIGIGQIKITAKIVDLNAKQISNRHIETYIDPRSVYDSKLKELASDIFEDIKKYISPEKHIIKNHQICSLITTIASGLWLFLENENVKKYYDDYENGTSIQEVSKARIKTEKSEVRRDVAIVSTSISIISFAWFTYKIYQEKKHNEKRTKQALSKKVNDVKLGIKNYLDDRNVYISFSISF